MKRTTLFKFFFTLAFVLVLFFKINFSDVIRTLLSMNLFYLAGSLFLVPAMLVLRTLRWNQILNTLDINLSFIGSLKVLLIGNFYGLITPGRIGELGRAYHMAEKKIITLPTIILEKLIDIWTLVGLSCITIFLNFPDNSIMILTIASCFFALILGTTILINKKTFHLLTKVAGISRAESEQFSEIFLELIQNYRLIWFSFFISILYYGIAYLLAYLITISAGFDPVVSSTLPLIVLMGNIPLTIAGIGIRESIGSLAFVYLGHTAAEGFVFAFLLFLLITVIPAMVGYFLAMRDDFTRIQNGQVTGLLSPFLEYQRLRKIPAVVSGGTVLDYGCGNGKIIPLLACTYYTGTDINEGIISEVRRKYAQIDNVVFYTIEELNTNTVKYDFIILSAVLEHLKDPEETMRQLIRRLKNHGKIIITTPTHIGNTILGIGSRIGIFSRIAAEEHNRIFSKDDFLALAEKFNLKIDKYETFEIYMNQFVVLSYDE